MLAHPIIQEDSPSSRSSRRSLGEHSRGSSRAASSLFVEFSLHARAPRNRQQLSLSLGDSSRDNLAIVQGSNVSPFTGPSSVTNRGLSPPYPRSLKILSVKRMPNEWNLCNVELHVFLTRRNRGRCVAPRYPNARCFVPSDCTFACSCNFEITTISCSSREIARLLSFGIPRIARPSRPHPSLRLPVCSGLILPLRVESREAARVVSNEYLDTARLNA